MILATFSSLQRLRSRLWLAGRGGRAMHTVEVQTSTIPFEHDEFSAHRSLDANFWNPLKPL